MRKLLIILALALLLGAGLHQALSSLQGYLVLAIGPYIIETTLWGGLVILALILASGYLLYRVWKILVLPRRWWRARTGRRIRKVRDKTTRGVLDYLEGNWPRAIANLQSGVKHSETPALNYLCAAAASFNLGDEAQCQAMLADAEESGILDSLAAGLLRARLLMQKGEFDRALTMLESLHRKSPAHPTVLRLLVSARKGIGDWHGLETLLADVKRHKALSAQELTALELDIYREIIRAFAATKSAHKSLPEQQSELDHLWDRVPNKLKKHANLIAAYVSQLQLLGVPEKAESRLRRFINKHWDDELARLYGDIAADANSQLKTAEAWLKRHPDNPFLLETLGKLCVRCQLWGKGKEYFEMSLKKNPQPGTWLELGEMLQVIQDTKGSRECYRNGLREVVKAS